MSACYLAGRLTAGGFAGARGDWRAVWKPRQSQPGRQQVGGASATAQWHVWLQCGLTGDSRSMRAEPLASVPHSSSSYTLPETPAHAASGGQSQAAKPSSSHQQQPGSVDTAATQHASAPASKEEARPVMGGAGLKKVQLGGGDADVDEAGSLAAQVGTPSLRPSAVVR